MKKLNTLFRNVAITGFVAAVSAPSVFAAAIPVVDTTEVQAQLTQGMTDSGTIATYVAIALAVLACAGVVFGMLRKS